MNDRTDNGVDVSADGWEQLASVSVDSGQLLLVDPSYLDAHWENKPFEDIRKYRHTGTGAILQYMVDFDHYETLIPAYGMTMNALKRTGEWQALANPIPSGMNYNAVCHTTMQAGDGGAVDGLAAAFATGYGDGVYPVYVKRNSEGCIMQVLINFEEADE